MIKGISQTHVLNYIELITQQMDFRHQSQATQYVNLDKLLYLLKAQFPHLKNKASNSIFLRRVLRKLNEIAR